MKPHNAPKKASLVLRREIVAVLVNHQLTSVRGGGGLEIETASLRAPFPDQLLPQDDGGRRGAAC